MNSPTLNRGSIAAPELDLGTGRLLLELMAEDDDDAPGASDDLPSIPGFDVFDQIGEGGGGRVFFGAKSGTMVPVAIKLLRRPTARRRDAAPDWREIDLLRRLRLQTVPRIHEYGVVDGSLYIVTDFVDGEDLAAWCRTEGRSRREIVGMVARVADAVQQLHERGVIHRDLKPSNVLVDEFGDPIILDFGLAEVVATDDQNEAAEQKRESTPRTGTPGFMSPEQSRGDAEAISTRSDVHGLAATAFVLLTGKLPHSLPGAASELADHISKLPARDAREVDHSIPRALAAVLAKGLATQPGDRYGSAGEFGADLTRWLDHEPVAALEQSIVGRLYSFVRRRPWWAGAIGVIVLLFGAVAMTSGWAMHESREKSVAISDLLQFETESAQTIDAAYQQASDWNVVAHQEWQKKVDYAKSVRVFLQGWMPTIEDLNESGTLIENLEMFHGIAPVYAAEFTPNDLESEFQLRWTGELEKLITQMGEAIPNGEKPFLRALRDAANNIANNKGA